MDDFNEDILLKKIQSKRVIIKKYIKYILISRFKKKR